MPPTFWTEIARDAAEDAHENHFDHRLGLDIAGEIPGVLVVFNNPFFAKFPTLQAEEREELQRRLSREGFRVLGSASYPTSGPSDGYSYALVIEAEQIDLVEEIQHEVRMWAFDLGGSVELRGGFPAAASSA